MDSVQDQTLIQNKEAIKPDKSKVLQTSSKSQVLQMEPVGLQWVMLHVTGW